MNFKLIETLLIALLPLFAATSAAQASAAGPMLRKLEEEEDALVSINRTGKSTCGADEYGLIVSSAAQQLMLNIFGACGISGPFFLPPIEFTQDEILGIQAVVGAEIWECISDACSFGGSAQLDVDLVCIKQGLINYLNPLQKQYSGIAEDGRPVIMKIIDYLFNPVF